MNDKMFVPEQKAATRKGGIAIAMDAMTVQVSSLEAATSDLTGRINPIMRGSIPSAKDNEADAFTPQSDVAQVVFDLCARVKAQSKILSDMAGRVDL